MLIYVDSCIFIYWLDDVGPFHARAKARMKTLETAKDQIVISDLTRFECRIGPLKRKDAAGLAAFDTFFARPDIQLASLSSAVFDRAAQLRADLGFKTPDALHLAAAIEASCDTFLTNDTRLSKCADISIEKLP